MFQHGYSSSLYRISHPPSAICVRCPGKAAFSSTIQIRSCSATAEKINMGPDDPSSCRPILSLYYLSKFIERVAVNRFCDYLTTFNLLPAQQTGYRSFIQPRQPFCRVITTSFVLSTVVKCLSSRLLRSQCGIRHRRPLDTPDDIIIQPIGLNHSFMQDERRVGFRSTAVYLKALFRVHAVLCRTSKTFSHCWIDVLCGHTSTLMTFSFTINLQATPADCARVFHAARTTSALSANHVDCS